MMSLGNIYEYGDGITKNLIKAEKLYAKALTLDFHMAKIKMANWYRDGIY
jgi:TPR repeat protein